MHRTGGPRDGLGDPTDEADRRPAELGGGLHQHGGERVETEPPHILGGERLRLDQQPGAVPQPISRTVNGRSPVADRRAARKASWPGAGRSASYLSAIPS